MKFLLSSLKTLKEELKKIIKSKSINYQQVIELENLIKNTNVIFLIFNILLFL
jgi:hypothetical protein